MNNEDLYKLLKSRIEESSDGMSMLEYRLNEIKFTSNRGAEIDNLKDILITHGSSINLYIINRWLMYLKDLEVKVDGECDFIVEEVFKSNDLPLNIRLKLFEFYLRHVTPNLFKQRFPQFVEQWESIFESIFNIETFTYIKICFYFDCFEKVSDIVVQAAEEHSNHLEILDLLDIWLLDNRLISKYNVADMHYIKWLSELIQALAPTFEGGEFYSEIEDIIKNSSLVCNSNIKHDAISKGLANILVKNSNIDSKIKLHAR